jgi:hypothetical protein
MRNPSVLLAFLGAMDPTGMLTPKAQRPKVIDLKKRDEKREARAERLARRNQVARPVVETYDRLGYPDHQFIPTMRVTERRGWVKRHNEILKHDPECSRCSEERERALARKAA